MPLHKHEKQHRSAAAIMLDMSGKGNNTLFHISTGIKLVLSNIVIVANNVNNKYMPRYETCK